MSTTFAPGTLAMAGLLTVLTSSQGLLTTASKTGGQYTYNFATVPLLAEATKFVISWYLLGRQRREDPAAARATTDWKTIMLFPIPSAIYMLHNNVQFFFLKYVDPATYQILGNLKIVTTGLLLRLALRRKLSLLQWVALTLLMVGATTSQINTDCSGGAEGRSFFSAPIQGYIFGLVSASLSAIAAVYTEWVMKKNNDSLYWQNMLLYGFGVAFNAGGLLVSGDKSGRVQAEGGDAAALPAGGWDPRGILHDYTLVTWLVVANLAFSGLLVSWVMKFADSIVKVYATSLAMLLTTLISIAFFGLSPSLQLGLGIITASCSVMLYYGNPSRMGFVESPKLPK